MTRAREEFAIHEASHKLIAEQDGYATTTVYLSDDRGAVFHRATGERDARREAAIAVAGQVGEWLAADPGRALWNHATLAEALLQSRTSDAINLRRSLVGLDLSRLEAREYVAEIIREVEATLRGKRREWLTLADEIEEGKHTPVIPGGHFSDERSGRPVYYAASPAPEPSFTRAADVDPFRREPVKPKRRNPARVVRDSLDRIIGIEGGDD